MFKNANYLNCAETQVYWYLGKDGAVIPEKWPDQFATTFNKAYPMNLTFNETVSSQVYISVCGAKYINSLWLQLKKILIFRVRHPSSAQKEERLTLTQF
jgi:hypothetical protein